jgi:hypothetical protein
MKTNQSENMAAYSSDTMLAFIDILGFKKMLKEKSLNEILETIIAFSILITQRTILE